MKTLPKYFIIKRDANNPLWDKYINWLNKTYRCNWAGSDDSFYGYDGGSFYNGTNGTNCYSSQSRFENNPTILTLEEWDEIVNGFELPEHWYIKVTPKNADIINEWKQRIKPNSHSASKYYYVYYTGVGSGLRGLRRKEQLIPDSDTEQITFEQFKKYILMEDSKKIIGYKLKDSCKDYNIAASAIEGYINCGSSNVTTKLFTITEHGDSIEKWIKAKVLDLWFEPVYKPKYSLPKINGYDGSVDKYGIITYGCAKFHQNQFMAVRSFCSIGSNKSWGTNYRSIKSITLDSGVEITIEQIKQILDYVDNQ